MRRQAFNIDSSKDVAKIIASHLENRNSFFAFSSVNGRLRGFFLEERKNAINIPKIRVKKITPVPFYIPLMENYMPPACYLADLKMENSVNGRALARSIKKSPNLFLVKTQMIYLSVVIKIGINSAAQFQSGHPSLAQAARNLSTRA